MAGIKDIRHGVKLLNGIKRMCLSNVACVRVKIREIELIRIDRVVRQECFP